jgi:branched-chain amino acid transport system permease protein
MLSYAIFFLILVGIYSVLALGLNIQWGYAGMFNIGVGAFFALGAYASAIVTTPPSPEHLGGFALPFWVGLTRAG